MARVVESTERSLTAQDRCDRCGAQAYMEVIAEGWPSELRFCNHHASIHEAALNQAPDIVVVDERHHLIAQEGGKRDAASSV